MKKLTNKIVLNNKTRHICGELVSCIHLEIEKLSPNHIYIYIYIYNTCMDLEKTLTPNTVPFLYSPLYLLIQITPKFSSINSLWNTGDRYNLDRSAKHGP